MPADSWKLAPGLNNVGSYQVSGRPFVSGACIVPASGSSMVVRFPSVTKWFQIQPLSSSVGADRSMRVAFSEQGLFGKGTADADGVLSNGGYNFRIHQSSSLCQNPIDLKVSELWFMSEDSATQTFDIIAGLTSIPAIRTDTATSASAAGLWSPDGSVEAGGANWSGSIGVG